MIVKPLYLLSVAALLVASPVLAQDAGLSMSGPPNFSSSLGPTPPQPPRPPQPPQPSSSSSTPSHMSTPPFFSSSSQEPTPPQPSRMSQPPFFSSSSSEEPPQPSHMSVPPFFSSSASSDEPTPPDEGDDETSEPVGPPLSSADAFKLFITTCTEIASGGADARDHAVAAGWQADEPEDTGPYVTVYSAYQDLAGYGSVDLWSSLESFPSQRLGYCRLDLGDADNLLDFNDVEKLGLAGTVTDQGNGNVYGSWESADHKTLLAANRTDGQVQFEFNVLLGPN